MTDQQPEETPEAEYVDLSAVELLVETTLYDEDCDEITPLEIVAGAQPFILLSIAQKEGENTLAYQLLGSLINSEVDLLESLEMFADALRAKILADDEGPVEGEVVDDA